MVSDPTAATGAAAARRHEHAIGQRRPADPEVRRSAAGSRNGEVGSAALHRCRAAAVVATLKRQLSRAHPAHAYLQHLARGHGEHRDQRRALAARRAVVIPALEGVRALGPGDLYRDRGDPGRHRPVLRSPGVGKAVGRGACCGGAKQPGNQGHPSCQKGRPGPLRDPDPHGRSPLNRIEGRTRGRATKGGTTLTHICDGSWAHARQCAGNRAPNGTVAQAAAATCGRRLEPFGSTIPSARKRPV